MILPFMTRWPDGSDTYFIDKIWNSLYHIKDDSEESFWSRYTQYGNIYEKKSGTEWPMCDTIKYHTIRLGHRWKPGMDIHFFINSRTKNMFRFAPVIKCVSTQEIIIQKTKDPDLIDIRIDGRFIYFEESKLVAINDGFENLNKFYRFFNKPYFKGQIVHWTNLKY
jgi:hypothetical protein